VDIFHGFDEMRLAEDEIHCLGLFDANGFDFLHAHWLSPSNLGEVGLVVPAGFCQMEESSSTSPTSL
jgi:hypothetical protein